MKQGSVVAISSELPMSGRGDFKYAVRAGYLGTLTKDPSEGSAEVAVFKLDSSGRNALVYQGDPKENVGRMNIPVEHLTSAAGLFANVEAEE